LDGLEPVQRLIEIRAVKVQSAEQLAPKSVAKLPGVCRVPLRFLVMAERIILAVRKMRTMAGD
jgi:hypothetical protein